MLNLPRLSARLRERLPGHPSAAGRRRGFTLIEILIVMLIIALLMSIVTPRFFHQVDRAKEAVLRQQLITMREAIDRFQNQHDRYPATLNELVESRLLRQVPEDPLTESSDTWQTVVDERRGEGVFDVHSGAEGEGSNGKAYATW